MEQLSAVLSEATERAGGSFASGELGFLALTSKVERPFLDRLSYQLHTRLDGNATIAREFPVLPGVRADLAVLRNRVPVAVIEAKAMTTADATRERGNRREYPDLLQADLSRYASRTPASLEVYCLLLATHLLAPPPPALATVIKYSGLLTRAFQSHASADAIRDATEQNLERYLRTDMRLAAGQAAGGTVFGIGVEVLWWLYGPFVGPDRLSILREGAA